MILNIFMDESSRSGRQRYTNNKWNFCDQPIFCLGALYIPSNNTKTLYNNLQEAIDKENFQGEFKWSNKGSRKNISSLLPILIKTIANNNAFLYFEFEDKRFSIAKIFTEYGIYPYYETKEDQLDDTNIKCTKKAIASYIADHLTDELLWEICHFLDSCDHDVSKLKALICKVMDELKSDYINSFCLETIDTIEQFAKGKSALNISNIFPIENTIQHNSTKSTLNIDPHTDCFGDLLNKAVYLFPDYKSIECIHDAQDQWIPALEETIDSLNYIHQDYTFSLSTKPGYHAIINTVDYIAGYVNFCLREFFQKDIPLPKHIHNLRDNNMNLISSVTLQSKVWNDNPEIKLTKSIYDSF